MHEIGQYLACNIPRAERFKFVQIKSMELQMVPPQGLKLLLIDI